MKISKWSLAIEKIYALIAKATPLPQFILMVMLTWALVFPNGVITLCVGFGAVFFLLALEYRRGVMDGLWLATKMADDRARNVHNMLNLINDALKKNNE